MIDNRVCSSRRSQALQSCCLLVQELLQAGGSPDVCAHHHSDTTKGQFLSLPCCCTRDRKPSHRLRLNRDRLLRSIGYAVRTGTRCARS